MRNIMVNNKFPTLLTGHQFSNLALNHIYGYPEMIATIL